MNEVYFKLSKFTYKFLFHKDKFKTQILYKCSRKIIYSALKFVVTKSVLCVGGNQCWYPYPMWQAQCKLVCLPLQGTRYVLVDESLIIRLQGFDVGQLIALWVQVKLAAERKQVFKWRFTINDFLFIHKCFIKATISSWSTGHGIGALDLD